MFEFNEEFDDVFETSKLKKTFFHFKVSDLGRNFIPRERTWIVAKIGLTLFERF